MTSLQFAIVLAISLFALTKGQTTERIRTEYGFVVGETIDVNLLSGVKRVTSFNGVPYAHAPEGILRFAPPQKHPGWTSDFQAFELGNACMQNALGLLWMTHPVWNKYSEDCLNVNIFKPETVVAPLPVLVWFHGGGYTGGANIQYPGHFMAARDVIVVTVNYRLGVFGFASSPEKTIPGNMGMLDQVLALEFVRDNIANFGGNPNRVTIYGQSAGASSSALHLVSPRSKGLYHQAILESGAENNVWSLNYPGQNPDQYLGQVADNLNCTYKTEAEMITCLRAAGARELRAADSIVCEPGYFCQGFAPIVDGPGGFMPDIPLRLREQLGEASVPIIAGHCKDDGSLYTLYFVPEAAQGGFSREQFQFYLRTRIVDLFKDQAQNEIDYENAYQGFDWFYTPWPYVEDKEANRQAINKVLTDGAFVYPWDRNAKLNSQYRDTYTYIASHLSPNATSLIPEWMGVPHNGELPWVWGYGYLLINPEVRDASQIYFDILGWVPDDMVYADYVQTMWSNFAKYGNPTPTPVPDPFNNTMTTWPKFSINDNLKTLDLDTIVSVKQNYRQPESYFFTEYMSYVTKLDIKKKSSVSPKPHKPLQLTSDMFQDAITKQVYELMMERFPDMNHLSLQDFKDLYDN